MGRSPVPVLPARLAGTGRAGHAHAGQGPLPELLESLLAEHGSSAQVIDMRRPKDAVSAQTSTPVLRKLAGTLTSLGACWTVLVSDVLAA